MVIAACLSHALRSVSSSNDTVGQSYPFFVSKCKSKLETTAVDQPLLQAYLPARGRARVPLLYPCRYARQKLSVRESDRRCSPLAFCPKRISVGRAHHHRKRTYSIRRFRTKLTFRRNMLHLNGAGSTCKYFFNE